MSQLKWLTGIKLVNWHYFVNETIRLRGSALLTGDNGSGKSTIFDAVQFVLIADQRRVRFNVSAHDETNRDLLGYLRCRTGRDDPEGGNSEGYLRSGDFTSYVALEFHDASRGEPFLVGAAIDTFAGVPDTPQFFRCAGPIEDGLFLNGDRPFSVNEFKAALKLRKSSEVFGTVAAYRTALKALLGHLDDRFFSVLIKALAFHPITDIRRFVYEYVLDEREVKIDAMLENFRQYRHYETLVAQTKEKLARLTDIRTRHQSKAELEATAAIQQYVILRAAREAVQENLDRLAAETAEAEQQRAAAELELGRLDALEQELAAELRDLQDARARNDAYQAVQALDRQLAQLRSQAAQLQAEGQQLTVTARQEVQTLSEILGRAESGRTALALTDAEPLAALTDGARKLQHLVRGDWSVPPADLSPLLPALQALGDQAVLRKAALETDQLQLQAERRELEDTLADLRKRKRRYPAAVEALREAIRQALPDTEPRVLCDLIDIPDERWQNAVEGYLNSQRFDLFVPPEAFDAALRVYEERKQELRLESVGLVNTEALLRAQVSTAPGALADEVVTEDPAARTHIDRLLGRLMKCESEQELKRFATAITPTCMTYRNHTARQIEFHTYAVPYIGSRAISRQIELKERRLGELRAQLDDLTAHVGTVRDFLGLVRGRNIASLQRGWEAVSRLPELHEAIHRKETERAQIDVGALNALQRQIDERDASLKSVRQQRVSAARLEERTKHRLEQLQGETRAAEAEWQGRHRELEQYCREQPAATEAGAVRYQEAARARSNQAIVQNFTGNRQGLLTQAENLGRELYELRLSYNHHYQFGGTPDAADNEVYDREYCKLAESELPAYESKIGEARTAAEQEFKEHFIFRLQENIRLARQEFESLNRVLKEIPFGQDRYQFVATPERGHRAFYDMIMDEYAFEGLNLFSLHFREKHGQTLDELFRLVLDVPEERQAENIRRYTDYRTYLEFDIRIHHANNETSSFSRVAREKSGGETQTPFYVAMIASFLQLYRPKQNPHTVRLMMFDEAFNRMDPDRAETMLQFIRALGMQVLAAAPTDKCEIITPHVETTLLVMREGHRAWLEDYHQVLTVTSSTAEVAAAGERQP